MFSLGEANEILELLQRLSYELLLNHRKGMLGDDKLKPTREAMATSPGTCRLSWTIGITPATSIAQLGS